MAGKVHQISAFLFFVFVFDDINERYIFRRDLSMLIRSLWEALPMLATGDHQVRKFQSRNNTFDVVLS